MNRETGLVMGARLGMDLAPNVWTVNSAGIKAELYLQKMRGTSMNRVKELLSKLYAVTPKCLNHFHPEQVAVHMLPYRDQRIEHFVVFLLDAKNNVIVKRVMSKGTVDSTSVYPREVMRYALQNQARGMIVTHNHPGGGPIPSGVDRNLTKKLQDAANALDIRLFDHVIVALNGHFSFQDHGLM
jgi:DNA repair protein RadC